MLSQGKLGVIPTAACTATYPLQAYCMFKVTLLLSSLISLLSAQDKGHATASWIPEKAEAEAGAHGRTVIRMNIEDGWHAYWENPGEAGSPIMLKTELPDGWVASELRFPAPKRLVSSGLTSFCYEGEILLPLYLTPPAGFSGKLPPLMATLTWLACNDDSCVPGKAQLTLSSKPDAGAITKAYESIPAGIEKAKLTFSENNESLDLRLNLPAAFNNDISTFDVFPVTRNVIDPKAIIHFRRDPADAATWIASAAKNEYLEGSPKELTLLLSSGSGKSWKVGTDR